jgi:hypothetical protein
VLAPTPNTGTDHLAVLSAEARTVRGTGLDGPRSGAGATPPLHASGRSVPRAERSSPRAKRSAITQRVFFSSKNPRTRPGRDSVEGESFKAFLRVGRPPGAPLISLESKREVVVED